MKKRRVFQVAFLLVAGMIIGAVAVSQLNWLPQTHAEHPQVTSTPATTSPAFEPAPRATPAPTPSYDSNIIKDLNNAFIAIADKVQPSVVTIFTNKVVSRGRDPFMDLWDDDFFGRFFRQRPPRGERRLSGQGSGVIVSADGYILTNNHVVRDADEIEVMFVGGRRVAAKIIGVDPKTDVAVIKVDVNSLQPIEFGDSDRLRVGEWVMAVGSPLSENLASTVTSGIVSAKGRSYVGLADYEDFIQTDAAINPGNSGGALVNLEGKLVGVNTAIVSQSGGFQGIGFAVPVNMARDVMKLLIQDGRVVRSWIGVGIQNLNDAMAKQMKLPSTDGALVSEVVADGPAKRAGIETGDVIVALDGQNIKDTAQLRNTISLMRPGTTVDLTVYREGKARTIRLKLEEYPEDQQVAAGPSEQRAPDTQLGFAVESVSDRLAARYNFDPSEDGVVIASIDRGSAAYREGLREGDLIKSINRQPVKDVRDFRRLTSNLQSGETVLIYAMRGQNRFFRAFEIQ